MFLSTCLLALPSVIGAMMRNVEVDVTAGGNQHFKTETEAVACKTVMTQPVPVAEANSGFVVQVVTFNVEGKVEYGEESQWVTIRGEAEAALLGESPSADMFFIAVQEKKVAKASSLFSFGLISSLFNEKDAFKPLVRKFKDAGITIKCTDASVSSYIGGCALYSPERISNKFGMEGFEIENGKDNSKNMWNMGMKGCTSLDVKVPMHGSFSLYSCHFDTDRDKRHTNRLQLKEHIELSGGRAIVGGDFNYRVDSLKAFAPIAEEALMAGGRTDDMNLAYKKTIEDSNRNSCNVHYDTEAVPNDGKVCKAADAQGPWMASCSGYKFSREGLFDELDVEFEEQSKREVIDFFSELPLNEEFTCFTCKWDLKPQIQLNLGDSDKRRLPGQCDRILFVGEGVDGWMGSYGPMAGQPLLSDHLPVKGTFRVHAEV